MSSGFPVVALAASAGGLNALTRVLAGLPADFPAAVAVVQHLDPHHRSLMAEILARRTPLRVREAREGDALVPGRVYIAAPNRHLLVNADGTLALTQTGFVQYVRPCADLLFESAATSLGGRAIAVVLSGCGQDGAKGVKAIKEAGGTVIVQDHGAEFAGMPQAARHTGAADLVLPLADIAPALCRLASLPRAA